MTGRSESFAAAKKHPWMDAKDQRPRSKGISRIVLGGILAGSRTGCASYARLASYGVSWRVAEVRVQGIGYGVFVHPEANTILVQELLGGALAGALIEGLTLNTAEASPPMPVARLAAVVYLAQFGCEIVDIWELEDITHEAEYRCPEGVQPAQLDPREICTDADPYSSSWRTPSAISLVDCSNPAGSSRGAGHPIGRPR